MAATMLQTLDRGLAVLGVLSEAQAGMKPSELALRLGIHKAIAYRLIATLESHGLVRRLTDGRAVLGAGLIPLAARVERHRLSAAAPHLAALSEATRTTSCVVLADGPNAVVALVQEGGDGILRLSYRLGVRHPLTRGASGLAILSGRPATSEDLPGVVRAREQGYAMTRGELQQGAVGIAAPIISRDAEANPTDAAVSIVALHELPDGAAEQVIACATAIGASW
ncbi:DNA-binding transcriptional regulator, IclR family [Paracoccus isoporae]|uniref:DNA-binding transcriptional regulator, IclR family n=1 Tax=Paracoccus isoporae TaxID=591205 RepID=A0A1G6V6K5_9RHOB|nr:helix-turn-helix domain-containing protein [Paracoccus isoporae]SDD49013.1 DNA-binding transcriptional regulator, IclR family [Paracoccus isoporae]